MTLDIEIFGSGLGDTFYPSNELDPYLKDKNVSCINLYSDFYLLLEFEVIIAALTIVIFVVQNDEDSEEVEDIMIKSEDVVVVSTRNEDDMSYLDVCDVKSVLIF